MKASALTQNIFYEYGWSIPYEVDRKTDWTDAEILTPSYGEKVDIPLALEMMRKIAELCREHNTELIIFTNPMHYITYTASVNKIRYLDFLEGLADISDFWNFSSLNDITLSNDCYLETSHYKAKTGDLIIDIMFNGKSYPELQAQGFGVKVTRENIKDFINMLKQQAEDYRQKNSPAK